MLERVLSSHSQICGGPEPHLLTPLAHLGIWANVQKAPYDHIVASLGQQEFVQRLRGGEDIYWQACRSYCETLYAAALEGTGKSMFLDKTPENATILPFITKVLPNAKVVVLTRHPAAIFCSFAESFFGGDFAAANAHDPVLERYIPALAQFIRSDVPHVHVRYEDFVSNADAVLERIYAYLGLTHEPESLEYGRDGEPMKGLGDPLGVQRHARPSADSIVKWAAELKAKPSNLEFVRALVARLNPDDLATLGYPMESLWSPLDASETPSSETRPRAPLPSWRTTRYRVERHVIVRGRDVVRRTPQVRKWLRTLRLACDVLLREAP